MSVKALFWALEQRIPTNPKVVLIYLSDWFNELEDCAWPSLEQLTERSGLSKSSVQRSINWLIEHKLVVIEHRFKGGWQKSNRFRLPIGVICLQGSQSDHPTLVTVITPDSQSDHPVEHTVKDTVKDTIKSGEPQEDDLKISEVIGKREKSKDEILMKFKLTPKGCADLWRDAQRRASGRSASGAGSPASRPGRRGGCEGQGRPPGSHPGPPRRGLSRPQHGPGGARDRALAPGPGASGPPRAPGGCRPGLRRWRQAVTLGGQTQL